ncbi:MAG: DUF481 domain-containing protein [Thermodesulfovibrionia bacterium]|nr:MAG: DUF481 domain-containing protein [Thermodesulfovibrionia bacterium]
MRNFKIFITVICGLFPAIMFSNLVSADEILLKNGDRLTGNVKVMSGEILTIETEYSEPIKIQIDKVERINTLRQVEVHLKNGEILKGILQTEPDGQLIVNATDERGRTVIKRDSIAAINPLPVSRSKWTGSITAGAGFQSGNTDRANATIGAEALRKTGQDRYSLRFLFNYAEENDEVTVRNTYGALKYDYFFIPKLYGYLSIELLNDEFKDLNLRTAVGPGAGYQVWDDPVKFLLFEGGVAFFSEDLKKGEDDQWFTGRLASNIRYNIKNSIIFSDQFIIYPSLADFGEYKLRNEAAAVSPLAYGWSLKLANILERDSNPPSGIKKNDLRWILGLQYDF